MTERVPRIDSGQTAVSKHLRHAVNNLSKPIESNVITCEEILGVVPKGFHIAFLDCSNEKSLVEFELTGKGIVFCVARYQAREVFLKRLRELTTPLL